MAGLNLFISVAFMCCTAQTLRERERESERERETERESYYKY